MMGLPYGEEIMIVGRSMWTQCTSVTDRQTDRRTDRITITKTVQRIASHGKNRCSDGELDVYANSERSRLFMCVGRQLSSVSANGKKIGLIRISDI